VVLGLSLVILEVVVCQEVLNSHGLENLSLGAPLGGKFSNMGGFPFINTSSSRGFFPRTSFGNIFPRGSMSIPGGNPLGGMSCHGSNHVVRERFASP